MKKKWLFISAKFKYSLWEIGEHFEMQKLDEQIPTCPENKTLSDKSINCLQYFPPKLLIRQKRQSCESIFYGCWGICKSIRSQFMPRICPTVRTTPLRAKTKRSRGEAQMARENISASCFQFHILKKGEGPSMEMVMPCCPIIIPFHQSIIII